jgi:hypothetical protein
MTRVFQQEEMACSLLSGIMRSTGICCYKNVEAIWTSNRRSLEHYMAHISTSHAQVHHILLISQKDLMVRITLTN